MTTTTTRRRALAATVGLVLTALVLASCASPQAQEILDRTNGTRAWEGRAPLVLDAVLSQKAQRHAQDMANHHQIYHDNLYAGVPGGWHALGENVAMAGSPGQAYQALLNSPSHHANISNGAFHRIGIGVVRGSDGLYYIVQSFWG